MNVLLECISYFTECFIEVLYIPIYFVTKISRELYQNGGLQLPISLPLCTLCIGLVGKRKGHSILLNTCLD